MIPFDVLLSLAAGFMLAFSSRIQLKKEENVYFNRYIYIAALWMALIYGPSAVYFYHAWPDWNSTYIFGDQLPEYLIWINASLLFLVLLIGFIIGHKWIRDNKNSRVAIASIVSLIALGLYLLLTYDRSFFVGTYSEWSSGTAEILWTSDLLKANIIASFIDIGSLVIIMYILDKKGKEIST